jgi:hypothetical protein
MEDGATADTVRFAIDHFDHSDLRATVRVSRNVNNRRRIMVWGNAVTVGLGVLGWTLVEGPWPLIGLGIAAITVVTTMVARRALLEDINKLGVGQYASDAVELTHSGPAGSASWRWQAFDHVYLDDTHIVAVLGSTRFVLIPFRCLDTPTEIERLKQFATRRPSDPGG